jgi:prevent-host-death family protein
MSETVGIRDLKNSASRIVERAEAGESITITRRGKPVARIVSAAMPAHLASKVAAGTVRPANGVRTLPDPIKLSTTGKTAAQHVSEGRR